MIESRTYAVFCAVFCCAILLVGKHAAAQAPVQEIKPGTTIDGIAAIVGKEIILESDVMAAEAMERSQMAPGSMTDSALHAAVLRNFIDQDVLYAKAIEDSVEVTDDEVSQQLDYRIQTIVSQYGSEQRLESVYGKTISELKREFRDEMKKKMLGDQWLRQKIGDPQRVTSQDVEDFYNMYKDSLALQTIPDEYDLADIAIAQTPSTAAKDSARSLAERLHDSLIHGAPFGLLAKRYSQDSGSAVDSGDLGFQKRGIFVKEFEQAAFGLKEGQISNVVETEFGFHIIQLLERRGDEVHVRHILIRIPKTQADVQSALDTIRAIRDSIIHGASFADLASRRSVDPLTKAFGGDMGHVVGSSLSAEILDSVKNTKPGEITHPVRAQLSATLWGYKIFLLKKIIPSHKPNLQQDYSQLESLATQFAQQKQIERIMEEVRKQVFCKIE